MKKIVITSVLALSVSGCGNLATRLGMAPKESAKTVSGASGEATVEPPTDVVLAPETAAPPPPRAAKTVEALDTTTAEQRLAAAAPAQNPTKVLGKTVVSLGSPTEPGLWLKTPLVKTEQQGRVLNAANGKSSLVTLIPIEGPLTAGSRMSLAAMRIIEVSLTDLSEVEVALEK